MKRDNLIWCSTISQPQVDKLLFIMIRTNRNIKYIILYIIDY